MEVQWKDLIERAKKNDQSAFSALYEHSYDMVYRTAKSMVKDEDTAMDIVQDAFVSGFAKLDSLQPPEKFIPWMRRIATNKALDWLDSKHQKHDVSFSQLADEEDDLPDFKDEKMAYSPEVVLDRSETTRLIEEILGTLSDEQRMAVGMYYYEEMSVAEIAGTFGVSENTIKSRLNYGRKKIKVGVEELEKKGTKLYSMAPIPFLIWLMRSQMAPPAPVWLLENILAQGAAQGAAGAAGGAAAAGTAAAAAAKTGFLSTIGAKIVAGVLAVALAAGGVAAGLHFANRGDPAPAPAPGQAEPTPEETPETTPGPYSEGLSYGVNEDGTGYIVYGIGSCEDADVIVPPTHKGLPVTGFNEMALFNCDSLISVTVPEGVERIDNSAFNSCRNLKTVTLPESLTEIGNFAFWECQSLEDITIPAGVTSIGFHTFRGCTSLTSITIPAGVTRTGLETFMGCTSLANVTLPEGLTAIDEDAFYGCASLTDITIPEGVTTIGQMAFNGCTSLKSITIPASVAEIGVGTFYNCPSLTSIHYGGTMAQWKEAVEERPIDSGCPIICADGTIQP